MKKFILYCGCLFFIISSLCLIFALSGRKMHDFQGKCSMCHVNVSGKDAEGQKLIFVDEIDKLCSQCHAINERMSHPIKIRPQKQTPLAAHLDKNGAMTCTTCHDIHKEDKTSDSSELSGLLWGHVKGRAFCSICHGEETSGEKWKHQTAIPYAHPEGKLTERPGGSLVDTFSVECLSCHDGTISKEPQVQVKGGMWQHGIGMSHPIGVDYPRSEDFAYPESLPKEVRLFDGKVGCLSCHEIYAKEKNMLVMNNRGSRLCLSCHKK